MDDQKNEVERLSGFFPLQETPSLEVEKDEVERMLSARSKAKKGFLFNDELISLRRDISAMEKRFEKEGTLRYFEKKEPMRRQIFSATVAETSTESVGSVETKSTVKLKDILRNKAQKVGVLSRLMSQTQRMNSVEKRSSTTEQGDTPETDDDEESTLEGYSLGQAKKIQKIKDLLAERDHHGVNGLRRVRESSEILTIYNYEQLYANELEQYKSFHRKFKGAKEKLFKHMDNVCSGKQIDKLHRQKVYEEVFNVRVPFKSNPKGHRSSLHSRQSFAATSTSNQET